MLCRTNNEVLHEREVALGARRAREELQRDEPGAPIRNDPAAGLDLDVADQAEAVNAAAAMYRPPPLPPPPVAIWRALDHLRHDEALYNRLIQRLEALGYVRPQNVMDAQVPHHQPQPQQPRQIDPVPRAQEPRAAQLLQPRPLDPRP